MSIHNTAFSIKGLNEKAYELSIEFLDENKQLLSDKKFTFKQESSVEEGTIWDVFTKNGTCSAGLPFTGADVQDTKKAAKMLSDLLPSDPLVCVLDLKDPHTSYIPCSSCTQTIATCEEIVCDFFQQKTVDSSLSKHAKNMHALFQKSVPVDFVICEGSLKVDLLQQGGFTDKEVEYFQATSSGKISFCKSAEFFMNGFKLGETAYSETASFPVDKFIKPLSKKFSSFQPHKTSTVFYPALYKDIYSPSGEFATVLEPVFSTSGNFDPSTKITTLSVEKKP
jgi:hypothetical protein